MQDVAHRATAANGAVRAVAVVSTQTVEDARIRHATSATATAALGRSLTAAALLGAGLKDGQTVLLRVLGDGPIGGVIAQADADGHVRGYAVHPHADLPQTDHRKLDVGGLVGRRGMLHVTRDLGLRTPYHGSAPLVSGEIAEDLASYLATSEQIPSVVALAVLLGPDLRVLASGGLCIQALPGTPPGVVDGLEARARQLPPITQMMSAGRTPEEILAACLGDLDPRIGDRTPLAFHCRCSRERVEGMLCMLGIQELETLLAQEGRAEVTCRFCGDRYVLGTEEVRALIARLRGAPSPVM
ncbi:MAG: Hsp33 family molecular chaperone HslO [Bacillati bacterium ANGP1]|uniref:33 kDa chaperonin n=1 Tax=Candidatus Segetimicrobium genomatis TaxID=2569760 RepID=A0A537M9G3_9BACT|nr:MAG: Hsp33 family molecular chaperone HslO [Terrabacteria group bacterium ANGP1]